MRSRTSTRTVLVICAVGLTVVTLEMLAKLPPQAAYDAPFFCWLGANLLYLAGTSPPLHRVQLDWRGWFVSHWREAGMVLAITGVALVLRAWRLGSIPMGYLDDEGWFGVETLQVISGGIRNPFSTAWAGMPTMTFYILVPWVLAFGNTMLAIRLPSMILGVTTIPIVYFLTKRLKGVVVATITATLLATYAFHIHYSRIAVNSVIDPFVVSLSLLLLLRAFDRKRPLDWALCGAVTALGQYFYEGGRLTPIIIGATTCWCVLRGGHEAWREHRHGIAVLVGAGLLVAAPMLQFAIMHPGDYNARLNDVGIFQNGWLQQQVSSRHVSPLVPLWDQLRHAAFAFNAYNDQSLQYFSPRPLLGPIASVLFLLGLGYSTLRIRDRTLFPMVGWWWAGIVIGGALTMNPPTSQRILTTAVPTVFFVTIAIVQCGQIVQMAWGQRDVRRLAPIYAAIVLLVSVDSVAWYFADYAPARLFGGPSINVIVESEMAVWAHERLGPGWTLYFFGPPRMFVKSPVMQYLAPQVELSDVDKPVVVPPATSFVRGAHHVAFVFLPERAKELDLIRRTFPGGQATTVVSPYDGSPLFTVYLVMAG